MPSFWVNYEESNRWGHTTFPFLQLISQVSLFPHALFDGKMTCAHEKKSYAEVSEEWSLPTWFWSTWIWICHRRCYRASMHSRLVLVWAEPLGLGKMVWSLLKWPILGIACFIADHSTNRPWLGVPDSNKWSELLKFGACRQIPNKWLVGVITYITISKWFSCHLLAICYLPGTS